MKYIKHKLLKLLIIFIVGFDQYLSHTNTGESMKIDKPEWCHMLCNIVKPKELSEEDCCGFYLDLDIRTIYVIDCVYNKLKD